MPRFKKKQRNIRNQQNVQDTHLGVSGNSTDSERSETSNRTNNSGSSYSDVQCVRNRDGQERLQNREEFNEFPIDYDDDTDENENIHGTEGFRLSNHSGGSNSTQQSGSSYSDVQGVQNRDGQERLQNRDGFNELPIDYNDDTDENEAHGVQQSSYCPRGPRFHHRTFRGQPIHGPLSPLYLQQQNVRETDRSTLHYDRRRQCAHYDNARQSPYHERGQCAQYDNAPNVLGREGLRFSNQSGGSNSTSYYADVGPLSVHSSPSREQPPPLPSARRTYCVLKSGLNPRDTESDQSEPKHKSCSIKRACQCAIWTVIFLGISFGVALSTFNNMNTNNLEKQILEGNNNINKTFAKFSESFNVTILSVKNDSEHTLRNEISNLQNETEMSILELRTMLLELFEEFNILNDSFNEAMKSVRDDSQTLLNETSNKRYETETSIQELKAMLLELFEEFQRNTTAYCINQTCSGNLDSGPGSDSGGQCYNTTTKGCVDACHNMCDGDYQSCATCNGYVTCANRILWQRNCSDRHLVWDDNTKRCESVSNTCQ